MRLRAKSSPFCRTAESKATGIGDVPWMLASPSGMRATKGSRTPHPDWVLRNTHRGFKRWPPLTLAQS